MLEGFVLDLLKLILTETILVIKKAYARADFIRYLYCTYLSRPPDFLCQFKNLAGATQRIKIDKIENQVAPAEEADISARALGRLFTPALGKVIKTRKKLLPHFFLVSSTFDIFVESSDTLF